MSWKLAELSWRQELGLYESRWDKRGKCGGINASDSVTFPDLTRAQLQNRSGLTRYQLPKVAREAEAGLGVTRLHTTRLSTEPHASISPNPSSKQDDTAKSTVPLLQSFDSGFCPTEARDKPVREFTASTTRAARSKSCSALESCSFQNLRLSAPEAKRHSAAEDVERSSSLFQGRICRTSRAPESLVPFSNSARVSSLNPTENPLWPTHSDSLLLDPFQALPQRISRDLETVESPTLDYLNHFLHYEGAIFEILNPPHNIAAPSVATPEDSTHTQFVSTASEHWSESLLLPPKMAGNTQNTRSKPHDSDGRASRGPASSPVCTMEDLYGAYRVPLADESPCAPRDDFHDGTLSRFSQNMSFGGQQSRVCSDEHRKLKDAKEILTNKCAGPPPDVQLPATPLSPASAEKFAEDLTSPSGQYGRTSDVLGASAPSEIDQKLDTDRDSVSDSTGRSVDPEIYRGPSLSDIAEDPTETEFEQEDSILSATSGSTIHPLLPEDNPQRSDVLSTSSTGQGMPAFVARDNIGDSVSRSDLNTGHEPEWETTEEEYEEASHQEQNKFLETYLPSLTTDTSLMSSQNVVSTWDPFSAKSNLYNVAENDLAEELKMFVNVQKKEQLTRCAELEAQSTKPLVDLQKLPGSFLQRAHEPEQAVDIGDERPSNKSTNILRKLSTREPATVVEIDHSSRNSAEGRYTGKSEPFLFCDTDSRDAKHGYYMDFVEAAAKLYARKPRRPCDFPNARLTVDRRHRIINEPHLLAVQRKIGRYLLIAGTFFYFFGGLLLIHSMASGGTYAHNAMIESCKLLRLPVVGSLHSNDAIIAQRIEKYMMWVALGVCMAIVAVLVYVWIV